MAKLIFLATLLPLPVAAEITQVSNSLGIWRNGCDGDYCYVTMPIEITAQPKSIFDVIGDCGNSEICVATISAAVVAAGGDPTAVAQFFATYNELYPIVRGDHSGNETHIFFSSPPGYRACNVKWNVWSRRPLGFTSDGGSILSATIRKDRAEIGFYADVPVQGFTEGQSWLKALVELEFVKVGECTTPMYAEDNGWGWVYMNLNDPTRPMLNGETGDSKQ